MSAPRKLAAGLLRAAVRCASDASRDWAQAMLAELDHIESDWAALLWALGSTTAIFRHSVAQGSIAWLKKYFATREGFMEESFGKKAAGVILGIGLALAVTAAAFGLVWLLFYYFPAWDLGPMPWWVAVIVIPELIFILAAVALWRKRRLMATGIVVYAAVLMTHFIVHFATHAH
jgi:hypothetical protein